MGSLWGGLETRGRLRNRPRRGGQKRTKRLATHRRPAAQSSIAATNPSSKNKRGVLRPGRPIEIGRGLKAQCHLVFFGGNASETFIGSYVLVVAWRWGRRSVGVLAKTRSQECERCTQECVRHVAAPGESTSCGPSEKTKWHWVESLPHNSFIGSPPSTAP